MPRIAQFYGIAIYMYYRDHAPPHCHGFYGEHEALYDITSGARLNGYLPRRVQALVEEWIGLHRAELIQDWALAQTGQPLVLIDPLP